MGAAVFLESFDDIPPPDETTNPGYQQGYDDGFAAACAHAQTDKTRLQDELVQAIADLEFTYGEARSEVTRSLAPLFDTITQLILPQCISAGFVGHICASLQQAATAEVAAPLLLTVHPVQQNAVAAALETVFPHLAVAADDSLSAHAAWITIGRQETRLDLDQTLAEIIAVLGTIDLQQTRQKTHG